MKMRLTLGILMLWILSVIKVLNLAADGAWEQKADMPAAKSGHKAEVINGNIYIIDGPAHNDPPLQLLRSTTQESSTKVLIRSANALRRGE